MSSCSLSLISPESLDRALKLRDLSDDRQGAHAMQLLVRDGSDALSAAWGCNRILYRGSPLVTVEDNYDALGYPEGGAARDARYTRYVSERALLRTQTSAAIPALLRSIAVDPPKDLLLVVPGLVYRRDVVDRIHVGEPHQMDLWRIRRGRLGMDDLQEMIAILVRTLLPGRDYRTMDAIHPYTRNGLQIDVMENGEWIEIGECGLASPDILQRAGLPSSEISGLAMGMGLDRLLMLRKGIPDIRLLRSSDPRVAEQMLDLGAYRPVSNQPAVRRDLSIAVPRELTAEELGDQVRSLLGEEIDSLECLEIPSDTPYEALPASAHARMGIRPGQKNLLVRLVIRHPTRTLTTEEANRLRDRVYLGVHRGTAHELTSS